jgi:molecular chaperone GrpE (heat shock protein)
MDTNLIKENILEYMAVDARRRGLENELAQIEVDTSKGQDFDNVIGRVKADIIKAKAMTFANQDRFSQLVNLLDDITSESSQNKASLFKTKGETLAELATVKESLTKILSELRSAGYEFSILPGAITKPQDIKL